jgi:tagaturonate reductase
VRQLLELEVMPTLNAPTAELEAFAEAVVDRFLNPSIYHKLISIALNSTSKFRTRLLPSLLGYVEKFSELPPRIVLALAALIVFYKGEWQGEVIDLQDDADRLEFFRSLWATEDDDPANIAKAILGQEAWWGQDLNQIEGLTERLSKYIQLICGKGMYRTLLQLQ